MQYTPYKIPGFICRLEVSSDGICVCYIVRELEFFLMKYLFRAIFA